MDTLPIPVAWWGGAGISASLGAVSITCVIKSLPTPFSVSLVRRPAAIAYPGNLLEIYTLSPTELAVSQVAVFNL